MKRLLTVIALTLGFATGLKAQSDAAVADFRERLEGHRAVVEFNVDAVLNGIPLKTRGVAIMQDNLFTLSGDQLQVYCDGKSVWIMDIEAEEVTIEEGELNLDRFLESGKVLSKGKTITGLDLIGEDGKKCHFDITGYDFLPKGQKGDFLPDLKTLSKRWIITDLR